jgi:hypothetical protein
MNADARRSAYTEGKKAIDAKRWTEALIMFVRLWRDRPTYDVALLLGQAELNLKQYRFAAEHLNYGIRNFAQRDKPEALERAQEMLDLAQAEVATIDLRVTPAGAEIVIDEKPAGSAPLEGEIFLDPGEHEISATAPGHLPARETLNVEAGETRAVTLALELEKTPASTKPPDIATDAPAPPPVSAPTVFPFTSEAS